MEQLHEKIRRLRKERGLRQNFIAEQAGFSQQHLCDVEKARRNPSTETVEGIARAFNMTIDELLQDVVFYQWDKPWVLMTHGDYVKMILEEE